MVRMSDLARGGAVAPPRPPDPAIVPPPRPPSVDPPSPRRAAAPPPDVGEPSAGAPAPPPPPLPPAVGFEAPRAILEDVHAFLDSVPDLVRTGEPPRWAALESIMERVARSLQRNGDLFWLADGAAAPAGIDGLTFRQARITVMASRIAMTVGLEPGHVIDVGAAAALSGIGLGLLPADLLRRADSLSGSDQAQYHAHPRTAAERLKRWGGAFDRIATIVLQHQEREQGQGFPQGLRGSAVRVEAKIVGLAEAYVSLTAPPSRRPGLRPHEAVREIVRGKHEAFPALLVKALLSDVTVFPPGTVVRLNSGETGIVVAVNRHHPLRPRVEILGGKSGPLTTPKIVDLSDAPFLYVTGPATEPGR
jgi:hypothetical protein